MQAFENQADILQSGPALKVAVVGSGISGLAAAWFLSQKHDVTLFEKNSKLGGHTNTVELDLPEGKTPVDTGFIVFNRPNYPNLTAMFAHLGVKTEPTKMSFGVSVNNGALEYAGSNLNSLFAQRTNLFSWRHWQMLREITRFNRQAKEDLARNESLPHFDGQYSGDLALPLGDYLAKHGLSESMQNAYLLPMAAAIWSCPVETMMAFPAGSFLRFFENHGLLNVKDRPQWETVSGGSQTYINKILQKCTFDFVTNSAVERIEKDKASGKLRVIVQQKIEEFDHVIMASHGDQSLRMLSPELREDFGFLQAFEYQQNIAYLHSDTNLMPKRELAWSSWNYLRDSSRPEDGVAVTYWMNLLQNLAVKTPVLVTLNPLQPPSESKTWQKIVYEHPVFTLDAMAAQKKVQAAQGMHNLWFCGAYNGYGFHEDGLRSAVDVARLWKIALPWEGQAAELLKMVNQRIEDDLQGVA